MRIIMLMWKSVLFVIVHTGETMKIIHTCYCCTHHMALFDCVIHWWFHHPGGNSLMCFRRISYIVALCEVDSLWNISMRLSFEMTENSLNVLHSYSIWNSVLLFLQIYCENLFKYYHDVFSAIKIDIAIIFDVRKKTPSKFHLSILQHGMVWMTHIEKHCQYCELNQLHTITPTTMTLSVVVRKAYYMLNTKLHIGRRLHS